jgi:uncharacterized surface protein with fasciclin (FAS1) repeats
MLTEADCDFELDMCGWANGQGDELQWQLNREGTPSAGTGPALDHTLLPTQCANDSAPITTRQCAATYEEATKGHYLYIEASNAKAGAEAYLISPEFEATRRGYNCRLNFYYHLYGADIAYLAVDLKRDPEKLASQYEQRWIRENLISPGEARNDIWRHAQVFMSPDSAFDNSPIQARFRAGVNGPKGDIGLDDIRLICNDDFVGSCECEAGYVLQDNACVADPNEFPPSTPEPTAPVSTCPAATTSRNKLVCEAGLYERVVCANGVDYLNPYCALCNNQRDFRDGRCAAPVPPASVIATCPAGANVLYELQCYDSVASTVCVNGQNFYNKACAICNGADQSEVIYAPCGEESALVGSCPEGAPLRPATLCAFRGEDPVCYNGTVTYRSDACADCNGATEEDLRIAGYCLAPSIREPCSDLKCPAHATCARTIADCDFEEGNTCGWEDEGLKDDFDWTIGQAGTYTKGTGPTRDHTLNSTEGHYLYIEASQPKPNHEAVLLSPWLDMGDFASAPAGGPSAPAQCELTFYYHMFGANAERLEVQFRTTKDGEFRSVWRREAALNSGEAWHDAWLYGRVPVRGYIGDLQIAFVGVRGDGIQGDIALDDIELVCDEADYGDCKCDAGYQLNPTRELCLADIPQALTDDAARRFEFLSHLLQITGLEEKLEGDTELTLLAPTDEALGAINSTLAALFLSRDVQGLTKVIFDHVFYETNDLTAGASPAVEVMKSLSGREVRVQHMRDGSIRVGNVNVDRTALPAVNGVIYAIDGVLGVKPTPPAKCGESACATNEQCHLVDAPQKGWPDEKCERCADPKAGEEVCAMLGRDTGGSGTLMTYRSACMATCMSARVVYRGTCQAGACVCPRPFVVVGDACVEPKTTTSTTMTTTTTATTTTTSTTTSSTTTTPDNTTYSVTLYFRAAQLIDSRLFSTAVMNAAEELLQDEPGSVVQPPRVLTRNSGVVQVVLMLKSQEAVETITAAAKGGKFVILYGDAALRASLDVPSTTTSPSTSTTTTTTASQAVMTSTTTTTVVTSTATPKTTGTTPSSSTLDPASSTPMSTPTAGPSVNTSTPATVTTSMNTSTATTNTKTMTPPMTTTTATPEAVSRPLS